MFTNNTNNHDLDAVSQQDGLSQKLHRLIHLRSCGKQIIRHLSGIRLGQSKSKIIDRDIRKNHIILLTCTQCVYIKTLKKEGTYTYIVHLQQSGATNSPENHRLTFPLGQ